MKEFLDFARPVARAAGDILMDHFRRYHQKKSTNARRARVAAREYMRTEISRQYPSQVVVDRRCSTHPTQLDAAWYVCALDGKSAFLSRKGEFGLSLGYVLHGNPMAGVLYFPKSGRLYCAAFDGGAYLYHDGFEERLNTSSRSLEEGIVTLDYNLSKKDTKLLEGVGMISDRKPVSLDVWTGVAHGSIDAIIKRQPVEKVQLCAVEIIISEAGGRMTDLSGAPLYFGNGDDRFTKGVMATNSAVHPYLVAQLRDRKFLEK